MAKSSKGFWVNENSGKSNSTPTTTSSTSQSNSSSNGHQQTLDQKRAERDKKNEEGSPNEKREVVMHGAELKCPYAQGPGKLVVTSNEIKLQDQLWATEGDGNNMVNLQFKGTCGHPNFAGQTPPPCMSVIKLSPWQNLGTSLVQEQKVLVKESYIVCNPAPNVATPSPIPVVESIATELKVENKKVIRLEITNEETGYTIQGLKGLDYTFSDPAVIVPTYKVNILDLELDENGNQVKCENKGNFDVTRDAWYCLGKNTDNKYELLNRAFIPPDYSKNLYRLYWIPSYPNISTRFVRSNMDAFIFTRFGQRKIPAKPLKTQLKLNGEYIDSHRENNNFATDVMIHIGGVYEMKGYDHLGGSYGCFAYIPKDDIYDSPELANQASKNDDYDDITSNVSWKEITNQIKLLAFEAAKDLQVILNFRDEENVYFPKIILSE